MQLVYVCAGIAGAWWSYGVKISVCNIWFPCIAVLKFIAYMYVLYMFGGTHGWLFAWMLIYNPLCLCVVNR